MGWKIRGNRYISRIVQPTKKAIDTGVDASKNINKGKRPRISSNVEPEYQKVFVQQLPTIKEQRVDIPQIASTESPLIVKEIEMPTMPTTRVRIKSSTDPFINMTQSMQNAYDLGLPGLQQMFASDLGFRRSSPLMEQLVDKTGRTAQSISKQINPETGQIRTNYFGVIEPNYIQWRKLHSMTKGNRPTAEEAERMFQTPQMKTIFSRMQNLLGIEPLKAKQVVIRKPYITPQANVTSNYIGPNMGPGIYGYHAATNEWWPLTKRSADAAAGNIDKYSMFSAIGEKQHLPQKISSRHNVIERGSTFEGYPFVVRANKNPDWFKFRLADDTTGPADWANSGTGSWKVRGHEQGGILSAKSGIHIKKENRGKFTKSAKAAGHSVQEHAHAVMNNPKATPLQRKRANFAIQAAKWAKKRKHENGGVVIKNLINHD